MQNDYGIIEKVISRSQMWQISQIVPIWSRPNPSSGCPGVHDLSYICPSPATTCQDLSSQDLSRRASLRELVGFYFFFLQKLCLAFVFILSKQFNVFDSDLFNKFNIKKVAMAPGKTNHTQFGCLDTDLSEESFMQFKRSNLGTTKWTFGSTIHIPPGRPPDTPNGDFWSNFARFGSET